MPAETQLLRSLGVMIISAASLVLLLRRFHVPTLVTYILTGLLLGIVPVLAAAPALTPAADEMVQMIADFGIILLLFIVGLELSLDKLRDVGRISVFAGIGQIVFIFLGGLILTHLLGFPLIDAVFIATALSFSSTVVPIKLLDQKKELHSLHGRIAVGIFLVQNLVIIVVLTFLVGFGSPEELVPADVGLSIARAFIGMAALLGLTLLAAKYLLDSPFGWAARSGEMLLIWGVGWCFLFVFLAQLLALSPEIGAFLAGLSLAQFATSDDLRRRVRPLMNFFIAIFFISLGIQMRPGAILEFWPEALLISLFVLAGNVVIFMWIIPRSGYSEKTAFMAGVTVAQISEFSLVFAALGFNLGLIGQSVLSLIGLIGLITIAASAYMILYNHWLYEKARGWKLLRIFRATALDDEPPPVELRGHVVVAGMNSMANKIVWGLHERGETVLSIDTDLRKLTRIPGLKRVGNIDHLSVAEEAFLPASRLVVSTLRIEDTNNLLAYRCKQFGVPVAIHAFDRSVAENLKEMGVDHLIESKKVGAAAILEQLRRIESSRE